MHELGPLRADHVLRHDARETGGGEQGGEALDARAAAGRELADDGRAVERVPDEPGLDERAADHADAADDRAGAAPRAQHGRPSRRCSGARRRAAGRSRRWSSPASASGGVEALGQQDRDLGRLDPLGPPVGPQRHEQLLAAALEPEPARRLDRARVRLAGEQLDVVPRPREQAAVDAAERAGPDDQHAARRPAAPSA